MKSKHQQRVELFMTLAEQSVPNKPTVPLDPAVLELRAKLILEEAIETISAMGVSVYHEGRLLNFSRTYHEDMWLYRVTDTPCLISVIDGCCDLKVVTTGTLSAFGIPDKPFQKEVDKNNLAKFGPGSYRREDGKLIKPPGHKPPDIIGVLNNVSVKLTKERHRDQHN